MPHGLRPIALPAPPPVDPTERLLDTPVGRFVERHAGDACSLLGIVGAATMFINHRGARNPTAELVGQRIVLGSVGTAGVDATIQARNVIADDGRGAKERGNHRSSWGTVAYAATGLIPAASIRALRGVHPHPTAREVIGMAALGVNGAVLGYESITRGPDMVHGREDASGYGSFLASLGGFVVAHRLIGR